MRVLLALCLVAVAAAQNFNLQPNVQRGPNSVAIRFPQDANFRGQQQPQSFRPSGQRFLFNQQPTSNQFRPSQPQRFGFNQPANNPRPNPQFNNFNNFRGNQPQSAFDVRDQNRRFQQQGFNNRPGNFNNQPRPGNFNRRPVGQPQQSNRFPAQSRPTFNQNNFGGGQQQFQPRPQQPSRFNPAPTTQKPKKKKKEEVDPASLNPPTEDNPSPTNDAGRRFVAQPQLRKCQERIIHARHGNKGYYFSWKDPAAVSKKYDWLDARNYCRQRCMDSVSIESKDEMDFVQRNFMDGYNNGRQVEHVWTSGRVCDFDGCDRPDLQPIRVNGWFWPATGGATVLRNNTKNAWAGWSTVGGFPGQGQPDNRQGDENCIAILNPSVYNEPDNLPHWHDVKCTYRKRMICEDNDNLLGFIRQENPTARVA